MDPPLGERLPRPPNFRSRNMRLPKEARQSVKSLGGRCSRRRSRPSDRSQRGAARSPGSVRSAALQGPAARAGARGERTAFFVSPDRPGIQARGHRCPLPVRRPGTDLGLRFFSGSGLDGFGFARLNRIRGPANAGGLHGRAEEACRHSAQYTPRLAAQESRSWSQAGASVQ
jgi:hypothetical protein